jgi:hypothetical protein
MLCVYRQARIAYLHPKMELEMRWLMKVDICGIGCSQKVFGQIAGTALASLKG